MGDLKISFTSMRNVRAQVPLDAIYPSSSLAGSQADRQAGGQAGNHDSGMPLHGAGTALHPTTSASRPHCQAAHPGRQAGSSSTRKFPPTWLRPI